MYQSEFNEPPCQPSSIDPAQLKQERQNRTQTLSHTQQRYLKAKPIALAALDLKSADRERFVGTACRGDKDLHKEVLWMLDAAQDDTSAVSWPPQSGLPSETMLQSTCGSCYRITRQLGHGGMGVVYLAERQIRDQGELLISQTVALKLLRKHARSHQIMGRFFEERRILAKLNHPNIAHLVDCGNTSDGRPFLAMEYVEGERIDHWCERFELSLHVRLELFLKICSAVHYAHQQCVIHRDIKPINILVNEAGEPKLLDFGIARLIDPVVGVADVQTQTVHRALTLAYASPEQIRGLPLTTATDVWSLGVLLYQLVCGICPFSFDEQGHRVPSDRCEPPLPSSFYASLPANGGTLDIDVIIMKALRHNPADRHADVAQMANELRGVLDQWLILEHHRERPVCERVPKAALWRRFLRPASLSLLAISRCIRLSDFSDSLRKLLKLPMSTKYPPITGSYALATVGNVHSAIDGKPCVSGISSPFGQGGDNELRRSRYHHRQSPTGMLDAKPAKAGSFRKSSDDSGSNLVSASHDPGNFRHSRASPAAMAEKSQP